ncbi:hypothetical protein EV361DRAFT_960130 [Lentinula raphanica]|uniref:Uncharacterized protein n=1 Tax=Lentinula raphanica TaxID=153919 RepID=A0AA38UE80_9AGAR|nr:hypothetical protein C8R42DRAFT_720918 [Lentinula raphanica]KAJ3838126.1 hypothetical protein F5878DRAFT_620398 [Lentinula raphanica]KAJ3974577.1 hypothetical protein EV361DRAFT_960130 [Lentinula raphanica]
MKLSLQVVFLALAAVGANAAGQRKRGEVDSVVAETTTATTGPLTLTATKVFQSLMAESPYMTAVTTEVVWTQYPVSSSSS